MEMRMIEQSSQDRAQLEITTGLFRILLIEDDYQIALMIEAFCKLHNLEVDHVSNCSDALIKAQEYYYDLVMLDVNLSDGSGIAIIGKLKELLINTDIMTMTGDNPKEIECAVREHGVIYHLIKPFRLEELKLVLLQTMQRKGSYVNPSLNKVTT